jgi:hypothetical protein
MARLIYSGNFYFDGHYRFTQPGEYEVDEAKAQQLLADFPDQFAAVEGTQNQSEGARPTKSLSKMNRAELEAVAADIGLAVTEDLDTNQKLKEAIETRRTAK